MSTTTHPFTPEEIMAFLDGELPDERAQFISVHFEQCAECRGVRDSLSNASSTLSNWTIGAAAAQLEKEVKAASQKTLSHSLAAVSDGLPHIGWLAWKQLVLAVGASAAVLVLLFAIATPNLLRSRMAANEASAVGSLRTLNTAAVTYLGTYGHFPPTLRSFGPPMNGKPSEEAAGLIDSALAGGRKSGYSFTYHSFPGFGSSRAGTYAIRAQPVNPSDSGYRHFFTDQTGAIRILSPDGKVLDEFPPSVPSSGSPATKEVEPNANVVPETAPMIARTAELRLAVEVWKKRDRQ
jgi:type IV pilus assembly protein PilA